MRRNPTRPALVARGLAATLGAAAVLLAGCSPAQTPEDPFDTTVEITDLNVRIAPALVKQIEVSDLRTDVVRDSYKRAQVRVSNRTNKTVRFRYQWQWLDRSRIALEQTNSPLTEKTLLAGESEIIRDTADSADGAYAEIVLQP